MSFINIEIKAKTDKSVLIKKFLLENKASYKGLDLQTDTYFKVPSGRLKLRQGNIENNLIFYNRINAPGPKQSDFDLVPVENCHELKSVLAKALGIEIEVQKRREIYFIENVKFHLDFLEGLGHFVEIEASNKPSFFPIEKLQQQCNYYRNAFGITDQDLVSTSYSDMLLAL